MPISLPAQVIGSVEGNFPPCQELPDVSITYSYCEDFESMSLGEISPQGNPSWTLFNESPFDQAFVVNSSPLGQGQALMFGTNSDVDLNLDRVIQSNARLEWKIFFPTDKTGDWGLETNNSLYALLVSYELGVATMYESGSKVGEVSYLSDQWLKIALVFQPDEDQIEFWMDGQLVWTINDYQSNLITDLNFFWANFGGENEFYVDDIRYYEVAEDCNQDAFGGPVCVNNVTYSFVSEALCAGYTDMEWTEGDCLTAIEGLSHSNVLRVYPNPIRDGFTLELDEGLQHSEPLYLEMTDVAGRGVAIEVIPSYAFLHRVETITWSTGLYFYLLKDEDGRILGSGKLVKVQ